MQPFIGPPIPIHLLATTSGPARTIVLAVIALSLAVHIVFLVWCFLFLRQWGREIDERMKAHAVRKKRSEQEHAERMKKLCVLIERTAGSR